MARQNNLASSFAKILIVAVVFFGSPAFSQVQYGPAILRAGKWLGEQVLTYLTGKSFDKALGLDYEKALLSIEDGLKFQLQKGSRDTQKLRVELEATQSQLAMLRMLMHSGPSAKDLESIRLKLASDLENVSNLQQRQRERSDQHEARLDQHDKRIDELEREIEEMMVRLRSASERQDTSTSLEALAEHEPRTEHEPRANVVDRMSLTKTNREGITLIVDVHGDENRIRVEEVRMPVDADVGTFHFRHSKHSQTFYLVSGTGGVITLNGEKNSVALQGSLCGRVRVVKRGNRNEVVGCD